MKLTLILIAIVASVQTSWAMDGACMFPPSRISLTHDAYGTVDKMAKANNAVDECMEKPGARVALAGWNGVTCQEVKPGDRFFRTPKDGDPVSVYYNGKGGPLRFSKNQTCTAGDVEVLGVHYRARRTDTTCKDFENSGKSPSSNYLKYAHVGDESVKACDAERNKKGQKNASGPTTRSSANTRKAGKTSPTTGSTSGNASGATRANP